MILEVWRIMMGWLIAYIVLVALFLFWNYCAHRYDED
jgi:hypothetical protein